MFLNPSNQLIQIDTGNVLTYLYNPTQGLGQISPYAGLGENQVLGQRYVGAAPGSITAANPSGAPAIFVLAQMLSTSAMTLAQWQTANAPAPVYWTDQTYTTITGIKSEGWSGAGLQDVAGYWMPNYASLPNTTLAQLLGGWGLVQVAGPLTGAYGPTSGAAVNANIVGLAGAFQSAGTAAASATRTFGVQVTAVSSGLCNVLVNCDIF
jgi:hypothetical protein